MVNYNRVLHVGVVVWAKKVIPQTHFKVGEYSVQLPARTWLSHALCANWPVHF